MANDNLPAENGIYRKCPSACSGLLEVHHSDQISQPAVPKQLKGHSAMTVADTKVFQSYFTLSQPACISFKLTVRSDNLIFKSLQIMT